MEEKQAEPLFLAAQTTAGSKDPPSASAASGSSSAAMGARFAKLTSECAIVLMHEEEDVGNKAYMIEAIRLGVVDVVRFPLVKQSMRTLWQHAVRRMIRVAARETRRAERRASEDGARVANGGSGGRRAGAGAGGAEHPGGSADSGDSTASEEGRVKRGGSSPDSVLAEEAKKETGAGAGATGKRKAGATGSSGSGNTAGNASNADQRGSAGGKKEDAGKKSGAGGSGGAAGKPKPQPRSTQQWRAAEQRGRRLAIKPHTAVVGGVGGTPSLSGHGSMRHGGVYYHPGALGQPGMGGAHAGVLGQTQTMTINGQQVQVWVPMNAPGVGGGAGPGPGPGGVSMYGQTQATRGGASGASSGSPPRGEEGDPAGSAGATGARGGAAPFYGAARGMSGQMFHGHAHSGMLLVQQANGQQVWVPAGAHHAASGAHHGNVGVWNQHADAGAHGGASGSGSPGNLGGASMGDRRAADGRGAVAQMRGELSVDSNGAPLGLGLKRSDSLQQMVESSGLLDADHGKAHQTRAYDGSKLLGDAAMDADMFRDAEMLEEDALDAILAHARDGGLLSFDGMDEAMLEAAAGPETGVSRA